MDIGTYVYSSKCLPKEGIVAYRVMRVNRRKKVYTSIYPKYIDNWEDKAVYCEFPVGIKKKASKKYLPVNFAKYDYDVVSPNLMSGFYAFTRYEDAVKNLHNVYRFGRYDKDYRGRAVVRVRLFGKCSYYTEGFKAEYMKLEAICCGIRL